MEILSQFIKPTNYMIDATDFELIEYGVISNYIHVYKFRMLTKSISFNLSDYQIFKYKDDIYKITEASITRETMNFNALGCELNCVLETGYSELFLVGTNIMIKE